MVLPEPSAGAPTVSVLLVVRNGGPFLAEAVASVLGQSWRDLEVVLIDNASDDGSVEALMRSVSDSRLRVTRLATNRFQAGGWAAGLPLCRGAFIAMMDGDDIAGPERIAAEVAWLRARPEFDLVVTGAEGLDVNGAVLGPCFGLVEEDDIRRYAEFDMPVLLPTAMMRRPILAGVKIDRDDRLAADYELLVQVLATGRVGAIEACHYFYRQNPRSVTMTKRVRQCASVAWVQYREAKRQRGAGPTTEEREECWGAIGDRRALHRHVARVALRDRLPVLAALHARRARSAPLAVRALAMTCRFERARLNLVWRLLCWGPIYALRVTSHVHPLFSWRQAMTFGVAGVPKGWAS